jgi:predicted esterase
VALLVGLPARADRVELSDGRSLEGRFVPVTSLAETPGSANPDIPPQILMCDDELRRTFFPKRMVAQAIPAPPGEAFERIKVRQRVATFGRKIQAIGPIINITPFDNFGRRTFAMQTDKGRLDIVQGISEVTPVWTKVEGLVNGRLSYIWDMRIATSSIPRATLSAILAGAIDSKNEEQRLKVVRLYLQSRRYQDARAELEKVLADFPDRSENLQAQSKAIRQLAARQMITEIGLRQAAGQHRLAMTILEKFPADDVAGETLTEVRQRLEQYRQSLADLAKFHKLYAAHLAEIKDEAIRQQATAVQRELQAELSVNTYDRLATYMRLSDDPQLVPEQKLALAISGWLLGPNSAENKIGPALSLVKVRDAVREYLREPQQIQRSALLTTLESQEGATPELIAKLIAHMKPAFDLPEPLSTTNGLFQRSIPGLPEEPDVVYHVQLPPEYDPYRRYPTVVTLHGAGTTAQQQLEWWGGDSDDENNRQGQAMRRGFITISVEWAKPQQQQYEYSAREHVAVLNSLRDACRRFSIDTDRVFLSGHSMGGDAAWDIALAHPDLWAGVIPIVALSDKFCALYTDNAQRLPIYSVGGEYDGDKSVKNARDHDRYLKRNGFDCTVVEYLGRGHENFHEEIQRIFDWMGRKRRDFFPREFAAGTMRPLDNFFWWVELAGLPARTQADPAHWPPPRGVRPMKFEAAITATNGVRVSTGAAQVTVWLSPELVNFDQRLTLLLNGRRVAAPDPSLEVLLEDVRTRGDRQHPFWAKVSNLDAGRGRAAVVRATAPAR